jgi:surfeit locus 1 family protein
VFGTLVVGTFGLGTWQTNRYFWKEELIEQRKKTLCADPVDLVERLRELLASAGVSPSLSENGISNPVDNPDLYYTRVSARGVFDHSNEICIGPRVPPKQEHAASGMNIAEVGGESHGYFVVTPLILDNGGGTVLVQRGWIPDPKKTKFKTQPALRFVTGSVTVSGVVVPPEQPRLFSPPNDITRRRFLWFDPVAACQATGIVLPASDDKPLILNAIDRCNEGMFPVVNGLDTYETFHVGTETHATYAATWYALSFFGAIMNYVRFLR